jgi:hypothetical protein
MDTDEFAHEEDRTAPAVRRRRRRAAAIGAFVVAALAAVAGMLVLGLSQARKLATQPTVLTQQFDLVHGTYPPLHALVRLEIGTPQTVPGNCGFVPDAGLVNYPVTLTVMNKGDSEWGDDFGRAVARPKFTFTFQDEAGHGERAGSDIGTVDDQVVGGCLPWSRVGPEDRLDLLPSQGHSWQLVVPALTPDRSKVLFRMEMRNHADEDAGPAVWTVRLDGSAGNLQPPQPVTSSETSDTSTTTSSVPSLSTDAPAPSTTVTEETGPSPAGLADAEKLVNGKGYSPVSHTPWPAGGGLAAIVAVKTPTADALTQRVFFFHDGAYLGTDTSAPSALIQLGESTAVTVTVSYQLYNADDSMADPSGGWATVRFHWTGSRLVPLDPIPTADVSSDGSRR